MAASRASSQVATPQDTKTKIHELTWGSELRGLCENEQHEKRDMEESYDVPSPIPDTEGVYFLLHGEYQGPESSSIQASPVKKLHFSKRIKKREKQELNFTLESLERLVISPAFRSNAPSGAPSPPPEPDDKPPVLEYHNPKGSLSSNAFIDPFITRQQTTLD